VPPPLFVLLTICLSGSQEHITSTGEDVWQIVVGQAGATTAIVGVLPAEDGPMGFHVPQATLAALEFEGQSVQFGLVRCARRWLVLTGKWLLGLRPVRLIFQFRRPLPSSQASCY
jgi:hypothetical protein